MRKHLLEANRRLYEMRRERWAQTEPSLAAIRQDWDRREREALEKKRTAKKVQDYEEQARKRRAEDEASERMRVSTDYPLVIFDSSSDKSSGTSDNTDTSSGSYDGGGGDFSGGGSSGSWSND